MKPNGYVVCVEYSDLLSITLPSAVAAYESVTVVTSTSDSATAEVAESNGCLVFKTDAFYRGGCPFNKGRALCEAIESGPMDGWLSVFDADIVFPRGARWPLVPGRLYGPLRHMLVDASAYSEDIDWSSLPLVRDTEWPGYCQVWHARDPVFTDRPAYPRRWRHAGGCDSDFQSRWREDRRIRLDWRVLHLGPVNLNWHGRTTPMLDGTVPDGAEERLKMHVEDRKIREKTKSYNHEFADGETE
jgi:hypothetical protein